MKNIYLTIKKPNQGGPGNFLEKVQFKVILKSRYAVGNIGKSS